MKKSVVLITGATSGIGKAAAELFCENGYTVYGTGRKAECEKIKENANGGSIRLVPLDVTDDISAEKCVEEVLKREGRIDILVNNAGFGIAGAAEDTSVEEMRSQLEVNLFGVHRMCRLVLPAMREQGKGRIINISSVAGYLAIPYQAFYSVSKYGVEGYSRALREEVRRFGIGVTLIQPGDTKTGFTSGRVTVKNGKSDAYEKKFTRSVKRMERDEQNGSSPEHIARAIVKAAESKNPPVSKTVGFQYKLIKFALRLIPERLVSFAVRKLYA